ncbi:MAG: outer membrane beta-barrel protein [Bacteroidia bacterium]
MKSTPLLLLLVAILFVPMFSLAQDAEAEDTGLQVSGSADVYYKYDFSGTGNIGTSFADDQNSISIGMLDLLFEKTTGKTSFVGEIAFGPRSTGNAGSVGPVSDEAGYAPRIQNLYVSYALTEKLSITGGYMGTFVGYEVISPAGNFNYSTSYLFTNGPFQNAGVKLDYAITDRIGLMAGVFNPWNVFTAPDSIGPSSFGAQLYLSPVDGWDAYINFVTGGESGTEVDLTTTFSVSDKLMLGVNAASYTDGGEGAEEVSFAGGALYLNYAMTEAAALGLRAEYFQASATSGILSADLDGTVTSVTLSGNFGSGGLVFIPELRFDTASESIFVDGEGNDSNSAVQAVIAAVYAF